MKSVSFNEIVKTIEDETYCYVELKFEPNAHGDIIGA
jgi:hypothetical protein